MRRSHALPFALLVALLALVLGLAFSLLSLGHKPIHQRLCRSLLQGCRLGWVRLMLQSFEDLAPKEFKLVACLLVSLGFLKPGVHVVRDVVELEVASGLLDASLVELVDLAVDTLQLVRMPLHLIDEVTRIVKLLQGNGKLAGFARLLEDVRHAIPSKP